MTIQNKTIIAIHGAGMQGRVWDILSQKLPCRELSLPGHGEKAGPLMGSIEAMAAWVGEQAESYPPHSIILMGHSMGALVALEAASHPSVAALVLMGASARMPVNQDLLKQAVSAPDAAARMILKWGISPAHPEAAEVLKGQMQPAALANDLTACNVYQRGETAAVAVRQPALVLSGADDKLTKPAEGKLLADLLPQSRW